MFVEIRKRGRKKKYYLVHSFRAGDKVKRISRYLGSDLSERELERLKPRAEKIILEQVKEKSIFEFELSKREIEEYKKIEKPLKVEHLQRLDWLRFTENFTYNTNAIEGSTVALDEAKDLIEHKEKPHGADEIETLGVANAVEYIRKTRSKLNISLIKKLHFLCFEKTKSFAGKLRNVEVVIRDRYGNIVHQGAPYNKVPKLLEKLTKWYAKHKIKYPPLLLAALVHNEFENIHPFQDGNGRVGRLLLNYVLLKHSYPPINIRFKDRQRYYRVLQIFEKKNDIKPTLRFLISQYKKQYR
ncbi:Fic family protein [Candidatus Woesearchaeota archaeon]|nr:Fic family protein [Candidatus Woesearchaeota archaeon]